MNLHIRSISVLQNGQNISLNATMFKKNNKRDILTTVWVCVYLQPLHLSLNSQKNVLIHLFISVSYTSRLRYEVRTGLLRKLPTPGVVEFWGYTTIVPSFLANEQREFRCRKCVISMVQNTACPTFGSTT